MPKQFAHWHGKPLIRHAVEALQAAGVLRICAVIPENAEELARECLAGLDGVSLVVGGETRQQSVANGLQALTGDTPDFVLIHDAARPDLPAAVVERLLAALANYAGAIPVLPVVDSMIVAEADVMIADARRETLRRVQTPQAFRFADILTAHEAWQGEALAGDDAQVLRTAGGAVALVEGAERLRKLTFAEDFVDQTNTPSPAPRIGMGYDVHRLEAGEELWLCGIKLEHDMGLAGHSDADVALHAVVDAILGAIGAGDIGQHFPPSDAQWKGAPSARFVEHAVSLAKKAGFAIGNVDLTIICEAPRIGPHRETMREMLAGLLGVHLSAVSVKATTTEKLGFTGRGEGIAAQAVALMIPS